MSEPLNRSEKLTMTNGHPTKAPPAVLRPAPTRVLHVGVWDGDTLLELAEPTEAEMNALGWGRLLRWGLGVAAEQPEATVEEAAAHLVDRCYFVGPKLDVVPTPTDPESPPFVMATPSPDADGYNPVPLPTIAQVKIDHASDLGQPGNPARDARLRYASDESSAPELTARQRIYELAEVKQRAIEHIGTSMDEHELTEYCLLRAVVEVVAERLGK